LVLLLGFFPVVGQAVAFRDLKENSVFLNSVGFDFAVGFLVFLNREVIHFVFKSLVGLLGVVSLLLRSGLE
jgi:hypothetical protein